MVIKGGDFCMTMSDDQRRADAFSLAIGFVWIRYFEGL